MGDFAVRLEPEVVRWAVESSAMGRGAIAAALKVAPGRVGEWIETGCMTYSEMRGLAECVRRPEAALLLGSPPEEKALADYRGQAAGGLGPGDTLSVRRARYAQAAAREMMCLRGVAPEPGTGAGDAGAGPPEEAARGERRRLGAGESPGGILRGEPGRLYGRLREAIESLNILVFQYPMDGGTVRGLSLTDETPYAILVNSGDPVRTRIVTLLHEYGHALLGRGGVCGEAEGAAVPDAAGGGAEAWCSGFAAAFLMPEEAFARERSRLEGRLHDAGAVADRLARTFKASRHAAAARAAGLPGGRLAAGYGALARQSANRYEKGRGGREADHIGALVSRLGRRFVRLTLSSHDAGDITTQDASEYLDTSPQCLEAVQARVRGTA